MSSRFASATDFDAILSTINDAAISYRGVIPDDCWHDPYMPEDELRREIDSGVVFRVFDHGNGIAGVMGLQDVDDVVLIRHAYVRSRAQSGGIGAALLAEWRLSTEKPMLIGTWAAAHRAVKFYRRHGFELVDRDEKDRLLRRYWTVPERQIDTSVVLADERWRELSNHRRKLR